MIQASSMGAIRPNIDGVAHEMQVDTIAELDFDTLKGMLIAKKK